MKTSITCNDQWWWRDPWTVKLDWRIWCQTSWSWRSCGSSIPLVKSVACFRCIKRYLTLENRWPKQSLKLKHTFQLEMTAWARWEPNTQLWSVILYSTWQTVEKQASDQDSTCREVLSTCLGRGQINYNCRSIWPVEGGTYKCQLWDRCTSPN